MTTNPHATADTVLSILFCLGLGIGLVKVVLFDKPGPEETDHETMEPGL